MHVLRERLVEVSGFAAVMLSQTLLEEPCLSRMFFHNEVSEKHVEQQVCRCCRSRSSRRPYLGPLQLPRRALPARSDRTIRSPSAAVSGRAYGTTLAQAASSCTRPPAILRAVRCPRLALACCATYCAGSASMRHHRCAGRSPVDTVCSADGIATAHLERRYASVDPPHATAAVRILQFCLWMWCVLPNTLCLRTPALSQPGVRQHACIIRRHVQVKAKERLTLTLYGRLQLSKHHRDLAAAMWRSWCGRRRQHDAVFHRALRHFRDASGASTFRQPLCAIPSLCSCGGSDHRLDLCLDLRSAPCGVPPECRPCGASSTIRQKTE